MLEAKLSKEAKINSGEVRNFESSGRDILLFSPFRDTMEYQSPGCIFSAQKPFSSFFLSRKSFLLSIGLFSRHFRKAALVLSEVVF